MFQGWVALSIVYKSLSTGQLNRFCYQLSLGSSIQPLNRSTSTLAIAPLFFCLFAFVFVNAVIPNIFIQRHVNVELLNGHTTRMCFLFNGRYLSLIHAISECIDFESAASH